MTKRALDISIALLLIPLAAPVVLASALLLAAAYRRNPFFLQPRVGVGGRAFVMVKLRTLPPTTPTDLDKYQVAAMDLPRIAALLRRTHLDELPQLLQVLTGRMSLVGPRPEIPRLHALLPEEFADARTSVRPGCTGLWQIGRDCVRLIGEASEYDLAYLRHQSWRLDVWVLFRTARQMLFGWRSLSLVDVPAWALQDESPAARAPAPREPAPREPAPAAA